MRENVAIVVPVWNRADLLRNLLATISSQTLPPDQVLVIDNGSTDDAPEAARRWGATVFAMGGNQGFAAAVNRGIAASTADWIALVNSDVELYPDWLERIIKRARELGAWFAGGKILMKSDPSRIEGSFDLIARSGFAWRAGHGLPDGDEFAVERNGQLIPATAAVYRRELFTRIGNFGEIYESYLEDVDLSLRAAAAGLSGIYVPEAVCLHHGGASTSGWSHRMVYLLSRNQTVLTRRLFPRQWRYRILVGRLLWAALAIRHGRFAAWLQGARDARRVHVEPVKLDGDALRSLIVASERRLFQMQRRFGMDLYWRLYFLFTGGGAK